MKIDKSFLILIVCSISIPLFAGGEAEGAASATHGKYLAGRGVIVPPDDVYVESYIAQIDYNYALPENQDFAVYTYSGNRQLSNNGQKEIIQIGIKANKVDFEDLPPLNLAFVIDKSGSMGSRDKLEWVQESFDVFIEKVRSKDYVSLITFSNDSKVVFPSTQMNTSAKRLKFKTAVHSITAGGGTNLVAGLTDGYSQVYANYRKEYNNRVLFLTDGVGEKEGIIEMAGTYLDMGVNVSTIGVGKNFDVNLMVELAKAGGGSSRFISDREEMKETFGSELDRMIVPAARNLTLNLQFPDYIRLNETWGYRNQAINNGVRYSFPTLHNGDYETILAEIEVLPTENTGTSEIARLSVEYETLSGEGLIMNPITITSELVAEETPVYGVSNYTVLQSSTMLHIARKMIEIGNLYYNTQNTLEQLNSLRSREFASLENTAGMDPEERQQIYDDITSEGIQQLEAEAESAIQSALNTAIQTKTAILNNKEKLDGIGFDDEIQIFDKYIEILGTDMNLSGERIAELKQPGEITPRVSERTLESYINSMFKEINLSIPENFAMTLAIAPFKQGKNGASAFTHYLNESALASFSAASGFTVLDRTRINDILGEQELSLTGLTDTEDALEIGSLLSAEYLITGNVVPMSKSVMVFSRLLNVETGEVNAVSQAVIPMNAELEKMVQTN